MYSKDTTPARLTLRGSCGWWPGRRCRSPRRTARCRRGRTPCRAAGRRRTAPGGGTRRCRPGRGRRPRARRQRRGEVEHPLVLVQVAHHAPLVVVAVLPAAPRVHAGRLDVAVRDRADPDVLPGGRQDEGVGPGDGRGVGDDGARGVEVLPAVGRTATGQAGGGAVDALEAGHAGGLPAAGARTPPAAGTGGVRARVVRLRPRARRAWPTPRRCSRRGRCRRRCATRSASVSPRAPSSGSTRRPTPWPARSSNGVSLPYDSSASRSTAAEHVGLLAGQAPVERLAVVLLLGGGAEVVRGQGVVVRRLLAVPLPGLAGRQLGLAAVAGVRHALRLERGGGLGDAGRHVVPLVRGRTRTGRPGRRCGGSGAARGARGRVC